MSRTNSTKDLEDLGCGVSCNGLYADIRFNQENFTDLSTSIGNKFRKLNHDYNKYKNQIVLNAEFSPDSKNLSKILAVEMPRCTNLGVFFNIFQNAFDRPPAFLLNIS